MSTNDYIRQSAQKYHWYKYYSVMRPVSVGTHPKIGMMDFINYDTRTEVNGRNVWAELYYNRQLTQKEMEDFEMIRGQGGIGMDKTTKRSEADEILQKKI